MSLNYLKDPSTQVPTLSASGDGVDAVLKYYENGTDEVKNLLKNECSLIYECSYCRSLHRSFINFVAHKRTICRSLQSTIRTEQLELLRDQQREQQSIVASGPIPTEKDEGNSSVAKKLKSSRALRRFNPASNVSKHIRPVNIRLERANANIEVQTLPKLVRPTAKTTILDGKQVVEQLPIQLAVKEQMPDNRAALVIPRETSIRYGEMQLRRRRSAQLTKKVANEKSFSRELTPEEIAIIERIPSAIPVDFISLRCEDERCTQNAQQPFQQLAALAHHLAIQHQIDYSDESLQKKSEPYIKCFLCDVSPFRSLEDLQTHFNTSHSIVREKHVKTRQDAPDSTKRKEPFNYRERSLSPISRPNTGELTIHPNSSEPRNTQNSSRMKAKTKGKREPKPIQIPEINLTREEQLEQQFEAAFALKTWIEARDGVERCGNGTNSEIGSGGHGNVPSLLGKQLSRPDFQNDSPQIEPTIDEEEARKIDQMLNSKTPYASNRERTCSSVDELSVAGEESALSLAHSRSPRPKRPTKKYENETEQSKKTNSKTPTKSVEECDKPEKPDTAPTKRKLEETGQERQKRSYKRRKVKKTSTKRNTKPNERKETESVSSSCAASEPTIHDFVLPESIKTGTNNKDANKDSHDSEPHEKEMADTSDVKGEVTTPALNKETTLPSVATDRYKEELILYTPKARLLKEADRKKREFYSEPSRRKQNFNELSEEGDGLSVLGTNITPKSKQSGTSRPDPPPKPKDLAQIPVYLTEAQRDLFFKPLKMLFNKTISPDGLVQCGECGDVLRGIKDGRRHMVSHIRVIRVRCSLCDVGAFFCSDMRIHLMYRHCDKLNLAPDEFVPPGNVVPCMDKEKADILTQLIDPYNPGRIMYSTGKIVSWTSPKAYYPDPKMERNILGPMLPGYISSPNASPRKVIRTSILSPKKIVRTQQRDRVENAADKATTSATLDRTPTPERQIDVQSVVVEQIDGRNDTDREDDRMPSEVQDGGRKDKT